MRQAAILIRALGFIFIAGCGGTDGESWTMVKAGEINGLTKDPAGIS